VNAGDDYTGSYTVGLHFVATACSNPWRNGAFDGDVGTFATDYMTVAPFGAVTRVRGNAGEGRGIRHAIARQAEAPIRSS
jgi:hypothetical protein